MKAMTQGEEEQQQRRTEHLLFQRRCSTGKRLFLTK
jgi:hypothetical protein